MCIFSSGSSSPAPVSVPDPVNTTNVASSTEAVTATNNAKKKAALAQGLESTINTSALGDTTAAPLAKPALLGQ